MKDKIDAILTEFGYTPSSLAKALNLDASAVSHFRSGRNKPGFPVLVKLFQVIPQLNPDWLFLNRGPIRRTDQADVGVPSPIVDNNDEGLFSRHEEISNPTEDINEQKNDLPLNFAPVKNGEKRVSRIIILYDDHTFESYTSN